MLDKRSVNSAKRSTKGAYVKLAKQHEKHGRASNHTGVAYGARAAGGADEHFETLNKAKSLGAAGKAKTKHPRRKTKEQRIVSG